MTSFRQKLAFACIFLLVIDGIIYFMTLAPAVQFVDSGELAGVCATLGIAHPTGYPLYTLLGRVFCLLPMKNVIFRINVLSLLSVCFTNLSLFFIILKTIKTQSNIKIWVALLTCLVFSFTPTLWSQATSNEVYGLNIFFYSLMVMLILLWREKRQKAGETNFFYLLVFIYGLGFGTHMLVVLLLPGLFFLLLSYEKGALFRPSRMLLATFLFLLGSSIYLYLPIRSSQNPVLDWSNPESWSALKRHITGWQYQVWMFSESTEKLFANLGNFIKLFFHQFPFYLLPLSLLGIYQLFLKDRKILFFLLILFFADIFYGINYDIPDIDPYFLGSFLVNSTWIGAGLFFLFQTIQKLKITQRGAGLGKKIISYGIIFGFILIPFMILKKNYFEQDKSRNYLAYDLTCNILRSMRKEGLILTNVWDHYAPWLYLRYVELKRPDLVFLNKELCFYSWYADYIKQNHFVIYKNSQDLIESYVNEIRKFENGQSYDLNIVQERDLNMLNGFFLRNYPQRPVYDELVGEQDVGGKFVRIPEGLVYSLRDTFDFYSYDFPKFQIRGIKDNNTYIDKRTRIYLSPYFFMIKNRISYLRHFGLEKEAQKLSEEYREILAISNKNR